MAISVRLSLGLWWHRQFARRREELRIQLHFCAFLQTGHCVFHGLTLHPLSEHLPHVLELRFVDIEDVHSELGLNRIADLPRSETLHHCRDLGRELIRPRRAKGAAAGSGLLIVRLMPRDESEVLTAAD